MLFQVACVIGPFPQLMVCGAVHYLHTSEHKRTRQGRDDATWMSCVRRSSVYQEHANDPFFSVSDWHMFAGKECSKIV